MNLYTNIFPTFLPMKKMVLLSGIYLHTLRDYSYILYNYQNALDWISGTIPAIKLDEYSGNYLFEKDTIVIKNENEKLASYYRGRRIEMIPIAIDEFFLSDIESYIRFTRIGNEKIDGIIDFVDYSYLKIKKVD